MSFNTVMMESLVSVGLEEDNTPDETLITDDATLDETITTLEQEGETSDDEAELKELEDADKTVSDVTAGLESLYVCLEAYKNNGGMDEQAAKLFTAAVGAVTAPIGGRLAAPMPSLESYTSAGGRLASTTVAMEGVLTTIEKLQEAIVGFVSKMNQAIVKWVKGVFTREGRVRKAIASIASKVRAIPSANNNLGPTAGDKIKVSKKIALWVGDGDSVVDAGGLKEISASYQSVMAFCKEYASKMQGAILAKLDGLAKTVEDGNDNRNTHHLKLSKEMHDLLIKSFKHASKTGDGLWKKYFTHYTVYKITSDKLSDRASIAFAVTAYGGDKEITYDGSFFVIRPPRDNEDGIREVKVFKSVSVLKDYFDTLETIAMANTNSAAELQKLVVALSEESDAAAKKAFDKARAESDKYSALARVFMKDTMAFMRRSDASVVRAIPKTYGWFIDSLVYALAYGKVQYKALPRG